MREQTKVIQIGDRKIGGGNPVAIQSMTNTKTEDVAATVAQIHALEEAGCDIWHWRQLKTGQIRFVSILATLVMRSVYVLL